MLPEHFSYGSFTDPHYLSKILTVDLQVMNDSAEMDEEDEDEEEEEDPEPAPKKKAKK